MGGDFCFADNERVGKIDRCNFSKFVSSASTMKTFSIAIGSDQGKNTDDTSNYDWYANIDQSSDASLYIVRVRATNRQTQYSADVWALRRPDLNTTPDGSTINPDGTTTPADGTTTGTTTTPAAGSGT